MASSRADIREWSTGTQRLLQEMAYDLKCATNLADAETLDRTEFANRVGGLIGTISDSVEIHAYDIRPCKVCGVAGQDHTGDDKHYPQ